MHVIIKPGTSVALIEKCGSSSIKSLYAIVRAGIVHSKDNMETPNRLAFIRDPFDRFRASFDHFYYMHNKGLPNGIIEDSIFTNNVKHAYANFVDYTLENNDVHWQPQNEILKWNGVVTVNRMYKFEYINEVWLAEFGFEMPHTNIHRRIVVDDSYRLDDVKDYYKTDYELRETL